MNRIENLFRPSKYVQPSSIAEAVSLLEKYGQKSAVIAGGTDILVDKNPEVQVLIDISGLELAYIKTDDHGVRIGAATPFADIEGSSELSHNPYNILARAASQMGTPQIRNRATIGGNICSAVPSADSAPALLVLDAKLNISGSGGERFMEIVDFFQNVRKNALNRGELLREIRLPDFPELTGTAFLKEGRVAAADLALVNVAVRLTLAPDGTCREVRIALGAVAPVPVRTREAESMLLGKKPQADILERVAECAVKETRPISDVRGSAEYRMTLSRILVEQALKQAVTVVPV